MSKNYTKQLNEIYNKIIKMGLEKNLNKKIKQLNDIDFDISMFQKILINKSEFKNDTYFSIIEKKNNIIIICNDIREKILLEKIKIIKELDNV